jgi:hypothetical protein
MLEPYAAAGQVFVALRLSANAPTGTLSPIQLTIPSSEACLPIRLTAIATVADMPITAFFLAEAGVRPTNYSTAVPDLSDRAFWIGDKSWEEAVGEAADALDGHAFAVAYSGPPPSLSIERPSVADLAAQTDPSAVLRALADRGYAGDPELLETLERHLVPPRGRDPRDYYNCLFASNTDTCGSPERFDALALAAAIEAEIVEPRRAAQAFVNRYGHLTRLYTELSPWEMTVDPVFEVDPRVPDESNIHDEGVLITECSDEYYSEGAPQRYEILGERFPHRAGARADDEAHCASLGAVTAESEEGMRRIAERDEAGGCTCGVVGASTIQGGFLAGVLLTLLFRRRRKRARAAVR